LAIVGQSPGEACNTVTMESSGPAAAAIESLNGNFRGECLTLMLAGRC
jgi:hypothetical protein